MERRSFAALRMTNNGENAALPGNLKKEARGLDSNNKYITFPPKMRGWVWRRESAVILHEIAITIIHM
jgi:hypothetical protein